MKKPVFVYGTLKRGESNHFLLHHADFICETQTSGLFTLLDLGHYPAVLIQPKNYPIHGEIYEVSDWVLKQLDELENYPHYYMRRMIMTQAGILAWLYYFPVYNGEVILDNGFWSAHKQRPKPKMGNQSDHDFPYH